MKKIRFTKMVLDLFTHVPTPGLYGRKDWYEVPDNAGYQVDTGNSGSGAGNQREELLSAPEYAYIPGQFGYGPFTYGDFSYKDQALLDAAKQKVNNFSYNPDEDTSYKAYARQYTRNGEDALRNTMARLASRTGGVASSYAVQAAQGAYNNYMQELANKVPELSELAYQKLQNEYNLYNTEYNRDLAKWKADRDFAYDQYEDAKDIAFKNFQLQESARQAAYDRNYNQKLSEYESAIKAGKDAEKARLDEETAIQEANSKQHQENYKQVVNTAKEKGKDGETYALYYILRQVREGLITAEEGDYIYDTVLGFTNPGRQWNHPFGSEEKGKSGATR